MNNNDDELIRTILRPVRGCATDSQYCDVYDRVVTALTTARKEAREEAFRDAVDLLSREPIDNSVQNFTRASAFKAKAIEALKVRAGELNERTVED